MSIPLPQDPNAQPQQAPQPSIEEIIQLLLSQMQGGGAPGGLAPNDDGAEAVDNPQEDALEVPAGADPGVPGGQDPQALMQAVLQLLSTKDKQAQGLHQPHA